MQRDFTSLSFQTSTPSPRAGACHPAFLLSVFACLLFLGVKLPATAQSPPITILHHFLGGVDDGAQPSSFLTPGQDGSFYGTTSEGGFNSQNGNMGDGTIFKIGPDGTYTLLYFFRYTDGAWPVGGLVQGPDGNFYGTAWGGGPNGTGTIFKITPAGSLTTLHVFSSISITNDPAINADGAYPVAGLAPGIDGNFYGVCPSGGNNGTGTIFKITPSGVFTVLHSFSAITSSDGNDTWFNSDGAYPAASLTQASDGNFYGIAHYAGPSGYGTLYRITPDGVFTVLHAFNGKDGAYDDDADSSTDNPIYNLVQASDGNLYGTTPGGGTNNTGTLYKISLDGDFTLLYSFSAITNTLPDGAWINAEGIHPCGLMQASDGNLYGVCNIGGSNGDGTIFMWSPGGSLACLYSLTQGNETYPLAGLIEGSDGYLYGTTNGDGDGGAVYRLNLHLAQLMFQNVSSGQLAVWGFDGLTYSHGASVYPSQDPNWQAVGEADFNGDGKSDLLFQNASTGQLAIWFMNGNTATNGQILSPTPPAGWHVVSIADFNGDGQPDLLLQNQNTGQVAIWYLHGADVVNGAYVTPHQTADWQVVGAGDFNGDGKPDILFQNRATGQLVVWYMNNHTATGGSYIMPLQQANWRCVAVEDLNGDGNPDLIFQNQSTGQLVYWLMNGVQAISGSYFTEQPSEGWKVVGAH